MRRESSIAIWSMGKTIPARKARIRAAITQWPTPVASATTAIQILSTITLTRPAELRRRNKVTSNSRAIKNPAILITDSERVTMLPAISFAFDRPNDRNTPKAAGATTAPKKSAAPNQHASKMSREKLSIFLIKIVDGGQQTDLGRRDLG